MEDISIPPPLNQEESPVKEYEKETEKKFNIYFDQNDMEQDANMKANLFGNTHSEEKKPLEIDY